MPGVCLPSTTIAVREEVGRRSPVGCRGTARVMSADSGRNDGDVGTDVVQCGVERLDQLTVLEVDLVGVAPHHAVAIDPEFRPPVRGHQGGETQRAPLVVSRHLRDIGSRSLHLERSTRGLRMLS